MKRIYNIDLKDNSLSSLLIIGFGIYFYSIDSPLILSLVFIGFGIFTFFYHYKEKRNRKVIFELSEEKITLPESELTIEKIDYSKLAIYINKHIQKTGEFYGIVVKYNKEELTYNIDNNSIQMLTDWITVNCNSIKIIDKRENGYKMQRLKNLKDNFQINVLAVLCFGFFLILSLLKYDSLLNHKPATTNGMITLKIFSYLDSIGGKYLLIGIFGFLLLFYLIKMIESKMRIK